MWGKGKEEEVEEEEKEDEAEEDGMLSPYLLVSMRSVRSFSIGMDSIGLVGCWGGPFVFDVSV